MQMRQVQSSNVQAVGYYPASQELRITFRSGPTYKYANVPESVYRSMMRSASIGQFVATVLKPGYKATKL